MTKQEYRRELLALALPISLQCLLQSSFSVVDQVMIGQLGSINIAAVGLAGRFISLLSVMVQAIAAVAAIILAQAIGKKNREEISKGFFSNLLLSLMLSGGFTLASLLFPATIMGIYFSDDATTQTAAGYLQIYALSFLPMALNAVLSSFLRCHKDTKTPLYVGIFSAVLNTILNYLLIYGRLGLPQLGVQGAAWASVLAQAAGCGWTLLRNLASAPPQSPISFTAKPRKSPPRPSNGSRKPWKSGNTFPTWLVFY